MAVTILALYTEFPTSVMPSCVSVKFQIAFLSTEKTVKKGKKDKKGKKSVSTCLI